MKKKTENGSQIIPIYFGVTKRDVRFRKLLYPSFQKIHIKMLTKLAYFGVIKYWPISDTILIYRKQYDTDTNIGIGNIGYRETVSIQYIVYRAQHSCCVLYLQQ